MGSTTTKTQESTKAFHSLVPFVAPVSSWFGVISLLGAALLTGGISGASPRISRPFLFGCGITWGRWLGLPTEQAKAFDRLSMDRIKEMGGTNVPANFAWIDIEPQKGKHDWDYVDHQVREARKRGLQIFAYTGLTPDWALPPEAPKQPGIGYRFPPDERFIPQFEEFFTTLARRYRGKVKYYEFWNEPNGCSWINEGCSNGHTAHTYVPWLKRWYGAMKKGDPNCVLAVGGLDYHAGVTEGYRYIEDIYKAGGGDSFDAVAIHPYGDPLHWKAIEDTYSALVRHGDGHKKLWLNEYGWNTADEEKKAANLREVLSELAKSKYDMVFQANYLVLTDLPETDDVKGHDFGLCSRDRRAGTITPRSSYYSFRDAAGGKVTPRKGVNRDTVSSSAGTPRRGRLPKGFMLAFTAPGCDPGEDCDDVGPPREIRERLIAQSGCNMASFGIPWATTEPNDPGDRTPRYEFSGVRPSSFELKQKYLVAHLDFFGNTWAETFRFSDRDRYNRLLERWAEAACSFARKTYGVKLFMTGGNERDLVARETYSPHFPDWHFYYMDPIKAIHKGMKSAHPDNKLIIGNLCYSDREHLSALYDAGAKGNFEVLAIHAYGPRGAHVDMEQVIESHEEMESRGDGHIPILLTEGWSSFPLPDSLEKDPQFRKGPRSYTEAEIEHYRQTVLDGWRNLITPRPGMYAPKWVCGAHYFVLNDHWGGRGWAKRAKAQVDEQGNLKGFLLDGYWMPTNDPDYIKPFLRPWGLIDIEGKPKGDTVHAFPPYVPRHRFEAAPEAPLPKASYHPVHKHWLTNEVMSGKPYLMTVEFTNLEDTPMSQLHFSLSEKKETDAPGGYAFAFENGELRVHSRPSEEHLVRATRVGAPPPSTIGSHQTLRLKYEVTFSPDLARITDRGWRYRVRPYVDLYYVWQGRPYHSDAWLPRVVVTQREPEPLPLSPAASTKTDQLEGRRPVSPSKIGVHLLGHYTEGGKQIVAAGPRVIKVLDPQANGEMLQAVRDYKERFPQGIVVMRVWEHTPEAHYGLRNDPATSADDFWRTALQPAIARLSKEDRKLIDYIEGPNEGENTPTWESVETARWFGQFWQRLAELIVAAGFRPCVGSIAVGNPPGELSEIHAKLEAFVPALETARRYHGAWSYHAYSLEYSTEVDVETWYSLRYRLFHDYLREHHPSLATLPMILTEGGIDRGGNARTDGWQARGDAEKFQKWLQWFDSELQKDKQILGVTLFQLGEAQGWSSFDLGPMSDWMAAHLDD